MFLGYSKNSDSVYTFRVGVVIRVWVQQPDKANMNARRKIASELSGYVRRIGLDYLNISPHGPVAARDPPECAKIRHHVVISGTGRAGTSFLVQLLTHLAQDTGYQPNTLELYPEAKAGLEFDVRDPGAPYIVKSPWLCDYIDEILANPLLRIDHAILPVRDFVAAAASRAHVQQYTTGSPDGDMRVPGGLWHTNKATEQAAVLRLQFTKLIEALARHDVPTTLLWYPRIVRDPDYLYKKLAFLLGGRDFVSFRTIFKRVVHPDWVHQFTPIDR